MPCEVIIGTVNTDTVGQKLNIPHLLSFDHKTCHIIHVSRALNSVNLFL